MVIVQLCILILFTWISLPHSFICTYQVVQVCQILYAGSLYWNWLWKTSCIICLILLLSFLTDLWSLDLILQDFKTAVSCTIFIKLLILRLFQGHGATLYSDTIHLGRSSSFLHLRLSGSPSMPDFICRQILPTLAMKDFTNHQSRFAFNFSDWFKVSEFYFTGF